MLHWIVFAQAQPPIPSGTGPGDLQSWLLYGFFAVGGGAIAYLVKAVADKEKGKDAAVDKMVEIMEKIIDKSDARHQELEEEHRKDREAFLASTGELKNAIQEATKAQTAIAQEIVSLRQAVEKHGGGR